VKKSGLKDMKKINRTIIIENILKKGSMSRIELAQATELSPSTVSGLVGEMIQENLLAETGAQASTGGRSRIELSINNRYSNIGIVEIARNGAKFILFDMALNQKCVIVLLDNYISGNDLLIAITSAVFQCFNHEQLREGSLLGFGLLFQDDMQSGEFNVMYSTGFSSANISLREALITQFHLPVLEEYSQVYTLTNALHQNETLKNSAHIAIGSKVLVSITLAGEHLQLRDGRFSDITPLLSNANQEIPMLLEDKIAQTENSADMLANQTGFITVLVDQLAVSISALCTLFPLETIFLSGKITKMNGFVEAVFKRVQNAIYPLIAPKFDISSSEPANLATVLAENLRKNVLCSL